MKNLYPLTLRIATDFASAVFAGWLIGYTIDYLFNLKPWCMVIFIFLGIIAGGLNTYRFVMKQVEKLQADD